MCPLNFRLSSGLLVEGGLVLVVSEWSALKTGATAALGRHTASVDTGNYTTITAWSYFTHIHIS